MNERKNKYEKRFQFQQKMIARQSEQINSLKSQVENLKLELKEKDEIINSVTSLRNELTENVNAAKKYKEEYKNLIQELKKMKNTINKKVYKGRWWLIKFLLK